MPTLWHSVGHVRLTVTLGIVSKLQNTSPNKHIIYGSLGTLVFSLLKVGEIASANAQQGAKYAKAVGKL